MMGYGEVGGNGSVHWRIEHHNGTPPFGKKPINPGPGGSQPGNDQVTTPGGDAKGKDGIELANLGKRIGHQGYFLVTLRYDSLDDAKNAGAWVEQNVKPGAGGFFLTVLVPANDRSSPTDDLPYEIRIDW
ncbi:MAG: hypothetical protein ACRD3C_09730 [Vicinamibacterales bacterium]